MSERTQGACDSCVLSFCCFLLFLWPIPTTHHPTPPFALLGRGSGAGHVVSVCSTTETFSSALVCSDITGLLTAFRQ